MSDGARFEEAVEMVRKGLWNLLGATEEGMMVQYGIFVSPLGYGRAFGGFSEEECAHFAGVIYDMGRHFEAASPSVGIA